MQVKAAREVMNKMLEAWKQVPDASEDVSPPPRSRASSKGKRGWCCIFGFDRIIYGRWLFPSHLICYGKRMYLHWKFPAD